jgi:uncharacterized protein (TIGR00255 family)
MAVCSMTAFARASSNGAWGDLTCELRSVNHRYLDLSLRLPEDLRVLETELRDRIGARLNRGKVDATLHYSMTPDAAAELIINRPLAQRLLNAAHEIVPAAAVAPLDVLRWPGVLRMPQLDSEAVRAPVFALLDTVLEHLLETRRREGAKLRDACLSRCRAAAEQVAYLRTRVPDIIAKLRERFAQRAAEIAPDLDEGRLHQECALLAQKLDVDEELERLTAHLTEAERVLREGGNIGRRLDFLMQELHREANTLGSKSAHVDSTSAAVELKVLIEQMREQVQNIE